MRFIYIISARLLSQLACLGRHTIAGLVCAGGRGANDWSADYRLFARDQLEADDPFAPVVRGALQMLPDNAPLDDTGLRKTGRKIPGVGHRRDPMSPPFHVNLVPGQRFVQLSGIMPAREAPSPARGAFVGRNRKDAKLHHPPRADQQPRVGSKRRYGDVAHTPDVTSMRTMVVLTAPGVGRVHGLRHGQQITERPKVLVSR